LSAGRGGEPPGGCEGSVLEYGKGTGMAQLKGSRRKATSAARSRGRKGSARRLPILIGSIGFLVCVVTAGLVVGAMELWRAITRMEEFRVRPGDAPLESEWIRKDVFRAGLLRRDRSLKGAAAEREARAVALLRDGCGIFEPGLARRTAEAYLRSPYVRRVRWVRKRFPNQLDVKLELREPFAVIRPEGERRMAYVVDEDGVVLSPKVYRFSPERLASLLPMVVVKRAKGYPCAGRVWRDVTVREGIKMLRLCREQFAGRVGIREIEVERVVRRDGTVSAHAWLVLKSGTRVQWGDTPSAVEAPGVASTPEKTAAFLALLKREGRRIERRKLIDLRLKTPIVQ